jgi:hypothetical protein
MSNDKPKAAQSAAQKSAAGAGPTSAARWVRMVVCVLTAGFAFPNVFIENISSAPTPVLAEFEDKKK